MSTPNKLDITLLAGLAYRKTWRERSYLAKMVLLPFLVKLACFSVVVIYIDRDHTWLTGIAMLPALFFEGWLLSHWARTIMTGTHRWPFRPTEDENKDMAELMTRGRGIMLGTLAFVVINYLFYGYQSWIMAVLPPEFDPQDPDPRFTIIGMGVIVSSFLLFRYLWLYIPLSINENLDRLFELVKPLKLTPRLIALWLICSVPSFLVFQLLSGGMQNLGAAAETGSTAQVSFIVLQVATSLIKNLIATAGFAYAFLTLLKLDKK